MPLITACRCCEYYAGRCLKETCLFELADGNTLISSTSFLLERSRLLTKVQCNFGSSSCRKVTTLDGQQAKKRLNTVKLTTSRSKLKQVIHFPILGSFMLA